MQLDVVVELGSFLYIYIFYHMESWACRITHQNLCPALRLCVPEGSRCPLVSRVAAPKNQPLARACNDVPYPTRLKCPARLLNHSHKSCLKDITVYVVPLVNLHLKHVPRKDRTAYATPCIYPNAYICRARQNDLICNDLPRAMNVMKQWFIEWFFRNIDLHIYRIAINLDAPKVFLSVPANKSSGT